jgi:hypothetical protein
MSLRSTINNSTFLPSLPTESTWSGILRISQRSQLYILTNIEYELEDLVSSSDEKNRVKKIYHASVPMVANVRYFSNVIDLSLRISYNCCLTIIF